MRENLLKNQPTWGLRRAQGTGHKSATPATLTKVILVLLTMFLIPSAAWGQWDTKTFVFDGCSDGILYATDPNVDNISYSWYYSNRSGASLVDGKVVKISVGDGLGKSVLTPPSDYTIKKVTLNYSNLEVTGESKIYVRAVNRTDTTTHYTDPYLMTSDGSLDINLNDEGISSDNLSFLIFSNDDKAYSYYLNSITITKIADYNLSIGDVPLTGSNVNPETGAVTGMTGISFTPANTENETPATLTLNNANFGPSLKGIIWSGNGNLKIQYSGNNIINTRNGSELNAGSDDGYCILGKSSSILILSASNAASTLTLKPSTGGTPESNNSRAAISGFENVTLDSGWGMYYTDDYLAATATSLTAGKEVVICKGQPYGISVGGVPVTSANINDVLNDGGTVKFKLATLSPDGGQTPDTPATLTLNGATISGNIQSSISPLTVYLKGSSTITNTSDAPFQYTGTATNGSLTFESSEADDGELTLGGTFSKEETGESEEKYFQFSSGNYTYSNSICPWYVRTDHQYTRKTYTYWGVKDDNKIFYNAHYGITIGDYEVTKFNKDMVTGSSGDFAYHPDGNYLSVPDNNTLTSSSVIYSHRAELNIQISGDCTLKAIKFDDSKTEEFGTPDTKVLNIDRSSSTPGKNTLTIYTESSEPAISGFTAVNISENLHFNVPETAPSAGESYPNKVVLSDEELYDLWVGGEHVSSRNASNILDLNEFNETQAVFDAEKSILTLTNARISVSGGNAIESGLANLTVDIEGKSNNIMCNGTNDHAFKATGSSNKITFTTTSNEAVSLSISGGLTPIEGFDTNYGNGLGLLYSSTDQKYSIETLKTPEITGTAETEGGITVELRSPRDDDRYASNTTIYYSISYSDETIDFAEYSSAFNMVKPGTVTAYLVPLGGKSNNAVGKYYGYPDAPYTMAVGDELTPEIYPAIDENDGIGLMGASSGDEDIASFTYSDGIVKATGIGSTTLTAIYSFGDQPFTVLNPIADPQASTEFAATFSVIVGGSLSDYFEGNNNFCTFYNTDQTTTYAKPEGMMAYVITGADPETGKVTTAETTVLPPNTPVLLEKGSAKAFTYIPATSGTAPSGNILLYTGNTDVEATEGSNLYVLYNDKFVKVTTGTRILSQKCYLKLNTSSGTRSYYDIDGSDGTTALREVKSEGVKGEKLADGEWYTLQGRKFTTKPTKPGLYIHNGKKVVIK